MIDVVATCIVLCNMCAICKDKLDNELRKEAKFMDKENEKNEDLHLEAIKLYKAIAKIIMAIEAFETTKP